MNLPLILVFLFFKAPLLKADAVSFETVIYHDLLTVTDTLEKKERSYDTLEIGPVTVTLPKEDTIKGRIWKVEIDKNKQMKRSLWSGFYWGYNGYASATGGLQLSGDYDFMNMNHARSWSISLNFFEIQNAIKGNKWKLITGLGYEQNNYYFREEVILRNATRYNPTVEYPTPIIGVSDSDTRLKRSKWYTRSLTLPLLINYCPNPTINKKDQLHMSLGLIGSMRYSVKSKGVYEGNVFNRTVVRFSEDFGVYPFGLFGTLRLHVGNFGLFANYPLNALFQQGRGPEVYPFSIGLKVFPF
jgi:hypothetical protein